MILDKEILKSKLRKLEDVNERLDSAEKIDPDYPDEESDLWKIWDSIFHLEKAVSILIDLELERNKEILKK